MDWSHLMNTLSSVAVAGLAAWQTRSAIQIKELKGQVAKLEESHASLTARFRIAVSHIREWMTWWRTNHPGTTPPSLPPELRDEV